MFRKITVLFFYISFSFSSLPVDMTCDVLKLSYIKSDQLLGLLKSMGYNVIEFEAINSENFSDMTFEPNADIIKPLSIIKFPNSEISYLQSYINTDEEDVEMSSFNSYIGSSPFPHLTSGDPLQRVLVCYDYNNIQSISNYCKKNNLILHLDGARIFNALVAKSDSASEYGKIFDSISVCLSKGLGAPVGSVLVGTSSFIKEAKRVRKSFGGGMRQAGYLAAAGKYALQHHINRLGDDHDRARLIGEKLQTLDYVENLRPIETNIVLFDITASYIETFKNQLVFHNIKASFMGDRTVRFVTNLDFCDDQLEILLRIL